MESKEEKMDKFLGIKFLEQLKKRVEANDAAGIKTTLTETEIKFLNYLSPGRYPEESYEVYKWRLKAQKKARKYRLIQSNGVTPSGKAIPRKKTVKKKGGKK